MSELKENTSKSRRPIASRQKGWAGKTASFLTKAGIRPNQISFFSMVFSLASFCFFVWFAQIGNGSLGFRAAALFGAALCIQLRLLCNLFDGMVAMEGGKASLDGPFWNEFPDRVADILIIVGASIAAGQLTLGWIAACLAIFVAYVRELGRANGLEADFSGPMAKQHRMAILTFATILTIFEPYLHDITGGPVVLHGSLCILIFGSCITIIRRAVAQVKMLKKLK